MDLKQGLLQRAIQERAILTDPAILGQLEQAIMQSLPVGSTGKVVKAVPQTIEDASLLFQRGDDILHRQAIQNMMYKLGSNMSEKGAVHGNSLLEQLGAQLLGRGVR